MRHKNDRCGNRRIAALAGVLIVSLVCADAQGAIYESGFVEIGGLDQWIQVRGADEKNPILFWVNGGPGGSTMFDSFAFEPWEEYFTVVMWDQRGEGRTFEKHGRSFADTMTVERMSEDGIEVAEYLRKRLPDAKIVLLGHSWGSILGVHMVKRRPDLFAAYVGTGQVVTLRQQFEAAYPKLLDRAVELGNEDAESELKAAGPPTASNPAAYDITNKWGALLEPPPQPPVRPLTFPPRGTQRPVYIAEGDVFSHEVLDRALEDEDVTKLGTEFQTAVFFFQGDLDLITTSSVVRSYYERLRAPTKRFVVLQAAGHLAIFRARDAFLDALLKEVAPIVSE